MDQSISIEEIQSMVGVLYIQLQLAHKENQELKTQIKLQHLHASEEVIDGPI